MGCLEVSNRLLHALGLPPKARIADLLEALKDLGLPPESLTLDEDALAEHVELLREGWSSPFYSLLSPQGSEQVGKALQVRVLPPHLLQGGTPSARYPGSQP